eukprot:1409261-Pyramimonas_sp.AAC.1
MSTFRCSGILGVARLFAARHSVALQEVSGRSAQAAYYQSLDGHNMLPDVFVKCHVMNQQGDAADVHVRRSAAAVLTNCKINEEYTDPQTVLCLRIIDKVRAKSFERRMAPA